MLKVNNKETRTKPVASVWCLYCKLWTYYTPCSGVSTVNSEQVNAGWIQAELKAHKLSSIILDGSFRERAKIKRYVPQGLLISRLFFNIILSAFFYSLQNAPSADHNNLYSNGGILNTVAKNLKTNSYVPWMFQKNHHESPCWLD